MDITLYVWPNGPKKFSISASYPQHIHTPVNKNNFHFYTGVKVSRFTILVQGEISYRVVE